MEYLIAEIIMALAVALIVALILRPFVCWYFKINERVELARKTLLASQEALDAVRNPEERKLADG